MPLLLKVTDSDGDAVELHEDIDRSVYLEMPDRNVVALDSDAVMELRAALAPYDPNADITPAKPALNVHRVAALEQAAALAPCGPFMMPSHTAVLAFAQFLLGEVEA